VTTGTGAQISRLGVEAALAAGSAALLNIAISRLVGPTLLGEYSLVLVRIYLASGPSRLRLPGVNTSENRKACTRPPSVGSGSPIEHKSIPNFRANYVASTFPFPLTSLLGARIIAFTGQLLTPLFGGKFEASAVILRVLRKRAPRSPLTRSIS
jgi:hypothetical protein